MHFIYQYESLSEPALENQWELLHDFAQKVRETSQTPAIILNEKPSDDEERAKSVRIK